MNIYDLRKNIHVGGFERHHTGCSIYYTNKDVPKWIHLNTEELFTELVAIGTYDNNYNDRTEFDDSLSLSQWDALNIAIRHELKKETDKELKASDIFEAIAKITKPNI